MQRIIVALLGLLFGSPVWAFDQSHAALTELLKTHVHWINDGHASVVDYAGLRADRTRLGAYLEQLTAVSMDEFGQWTLAQRQAFLINAYNAQTLNLIVMSDPALKSIKDLGGFFSSPWQKGFFQLLGAERTLDDVEHKLLRGAPDFSEPRIHFAVNCASVGCPALRPEAYVAEQLDSQLHDQTVRFLGDRQRNRYDAATATLTISKIFDWYEADFERGWKGADSVSGFLATYAEALGADAAAAQRWRVGEVELDYGDYDWSLNQTP